MAVKLILITVINQIVLLSLPIKEFFTRPLFNNNFMGYFIKWIAVPSYAISFFTSIVAIYFFAISIINKQNEKPLKAQTKIKIGLILFLISITATAVVSSLIILFK